MPTAKKIRFFKQVAILLSVVWTLMTYAFFTYQLHNEQNHIMRNITTKAQTTTKQAEELIVWAFAEKAKVIKKNHNIDMNIGFSLRELIYNMAKDNGSEIKVEGNYYEDDLTNLNENIKSTTCIASANRAGIPCAGRLPDVRA